MEIPKQFVKSANDAVLVSLTLTLHRFRKRCSSVFIVDFEYVNTGWIYTDYQLFPLLIWKNTHQIQKQKMLNFERVYCRLKNNAENGQSGYKTYVRTCICFNNISGNDTVFHRYVILFHGNFFSGIP